jgi:hypothetical protein
VAVEKVGKLENMLKKGRHGKRKQKLVETKKKRWFSRSGK